MDKTAQNLSLPMRARRMSRLAPIAGVAFALSGCFLGNDAPAPVARPDNLAAANPAPDDRGIITYASYQVAVAREGDTLNTLAGRLGVPTADLASLNALPADYRLRADEVVLLPDAVPRPVQVAAADPGLSTSDISTQPLGWSPERASAAIEAAPATGSPAPFQNGEREPLIDPVRHRVETGETAYSIARLYGVSVTALASWNGLGPDLGVREGQELLIPIVSGANQVAGAASTEPGEGTGVAAPPSASSPLPENITAGVAPDSPGLGEFRTPPGGRLSPPVSGAVTKAYNPDPGPNRSEGIGFAVPPGTAVQAAGSGEVALVSQSIGGLGTIVLIRHGDDLMTVYGKVDGVTVERGEQVRQGQTIGTVAPGTDPGLHFEVRRGTESVDPAPYISG